MLTKVILWRYIFYVLIYQTYIMKCRLNCMIYQYVLSTGILQQYSLIGIGNDKKFEKMNAIFKMKSTFMVFFGRRSVSIYLYTVQPGEPGAHHVDC